MISLCSIFFAISLFKTVEFVCAKPRFNLNPKDNDAIEGTQTLLICSTDGLEEGMVVSWMRDETRITEGKNVLDVLNKKRYNVELNPSGKMHTLYIDPVQITDADHTFLCIVYKGEEVLLRSSSCKLVIIQVPSPQFPQCYTSKTSYIENVDKATVICITEDVEPKPTIIFMYDNKPVGDGNTERLNGQLVMKYTFTVNREYDGKTMICSQKTSAVPSEVRNCTAGPLRVKYKPSVTIQGNIFHNVGKEELFVCSAKAKPAPTVFLWTFQPYLPSDYYTTENNNQVLRLKIPNKYNGTTIRCEVHNSVGDSLHEIQIFTQCDSSEPTVTAGKVGSENAQNKNNGLGSSVDSTTMLSIAGSALILTALLIGILLCYFQICKIQRNSLTASGYRIAQPEVYFVPKDSIAPSVQNCDCNDWKRTIGIQVPTDLDIESVYMDIEDGKKTCSHKSV